MPAAADDPQLWWLAGESVDDVRTDLEGRTPDDPPPQRGDGPVRLGIVGPDDRKLRLARRLLSEGTRWQGRGDIWFRPDGQARSGRVAFLFPGVEPTFGAEAMHLDALGRRLGLEAPAVADDSVAHRSASIVKIGVFLDRVVRALGVLPDVIAGHSIGEWSGTVAAGIVPPDQMGELLAAVDLAEVELPDLDFAAFSAGVDLVAPVVDALDNVVVSHDNAPGQAIVCGWPPVVDEVIARLRDQGVLGYRLGFQSGFHTPVMEESLGEFRAHLDALDMAPATTPLWSATTVGPYPDARGEIIELHLRHLTEPVRFRPLIQRLHDEAGVRVFVQMGVGSLTGFVADSLEGRDHLAVPLLAPKRSALAQMHRALTALWVEGLDVRPDALQPEPAATPTAGAGAGSVTFALAATPASEPAPAPAPVAAAAEPDAAPAAHVAASAGVFAPATALAGGPVPVSLVGAAELIGTAARASQGVLSALVARLDPAASARPPSGATATTLLAEPPGPGPAVVAPRVPHTSAVPEPAPAPPPAAPAAPRPPADRSPAPTAGNGSDDTPPGPWDPPSSDLPWPTCKTKLVRRLSLETMPETLDHTLFECPEDWPDPADRFPIVAMTTQLQLIEDIAAAHAGGRDVVEVFGVRNFRWLDISDPVDLEITVVPDGDDVLAITLGPYCRAKVRVGTYPTGPRHDAPPLTSPRPTQHTAQEMFDLRLMFHGPRFQGIPAMGPIGADGMLADFTHLPTPGSLLDNLGKLIAYWAIDKGGVGEAALPIGLTSVKHYGPLPPPGTPVHCDIRVVDLPRDQIKADGVLVLPDGTVLSEVRGWTSILFHLDEMMEPVHHGVGRHDVAEVQPGGWATVRERWPTGPARDLTARRFLTRGEREAYAGMNLLEQRRWLIDAITAKDVYRHWLRDRFGIESFPFEAEVVPDGDRRYRIDCPRTPPGHDPRVTLWSFNWMAVATIGDGGHRDIEAREVPDGADAAAVARELAGDVAARNPGTEVASVPGPVNVVPCRLGMPDPPPYAVAWVSDGDPWTL